jgi:chromosome segregation ATPase
MAPQMSFAQALNEAKGVIVQLSTRVKSDAEKIRSQQQTIVSQSSTIAQHEARAADLEAQLAHHVEQIATLTERLRDADSAREHSEMILNRQGEKITTLQAANAELEARLDEHKTQIAELSQERNELHTQLPSEADAAALVAMSQLLNKAAPAIEKARKSAPQMRLADHDEPIAQAA